MQSQRSSLPVIQMKIWVFAAGVICGALGYAAVDRLTRTGAPDSAATRAANVGREENRARKPDARSPQPRERSQEGDADQHRSRDDAVDQNDASPASTPAGATAGEARLNRPFEPEAASNGTTAPAAGASEASKPARLLWADKAKAKLMEEPEDTAWAPYMEQNISMFLSRHPAAGEFEIAYIDCRTSRCQVKAIGFDESTGPTWNRIVFEMTREPWATIGETGSSFGMLDGRFVIVQDLHRRQ
jgi:hypothetical protein